jgi:hypothetical protein
MQLYIKTNPNPQTLIEKVYSATKPDGYELATEQAVSEWIHSQIVAGWEPTFPDLPIEDQKLIVEQQRNTYREQSLFLKAQVTSLTADLAISAEEINKLNADHAEALQAVQADLATSNVTIETLQATIESLEATIVELTPPPKPESVTPAQIRLWLIAHGISLETVSQMIAAIPDEATRAAAQVRWEYGLVVLRDDPLVQQMGAALGLTTDQMDAAFLAASQIV